MRNDITITFFSNFLLHHQTPFCEAMVELIGENFHYVATEHIPQERLDMGYRDLSHSATYAVNSYEDYEEALRLSRESDVVIIGDAPDEFIKDRIRENRLTFRYCERYFKESRLRIIDPRVFLMRLRKDFRYRNKNLHMLCAGAYMASDCRFILSYPHKTYKWGYFPSVEKRDDIHALIQKKEPSSLLWAGRLIRSKHPEAAILTAHKLKENGYSFRLTMIGEGEEKENCLRLIEKYSLQDSVQMLGFMPPDDVRQYMESADIYLFTSDRNEGWGAVLNESMASACAVVACKEIGSVPYLIRHGENGMIYKRYRRNALYRNVKRLLDDAAYKKRLQINAYETMVTLWNADVAAERFLHLVDSIRNEQESEYTDGPCSRD